MCHRIEIFRADGRQNGELHAFVNALRMPHVVRTAIHGYIVAACCKPGGELFCKCLETAVVGRDAAGSEDRQFHRVGL